MHCGKHVVCGIPTWLFGTTENLKIMGKIRGMKDPQILQTENMHLSNHHMAPIFYGNSLPQTEEECGIWDSLCEANN